MTVKTSSGYERIGAHMYDVAAGRCRYCGLTHEQIDDQAHSKCVRHTAGNAKKARALALRLQRARDRMLSRTPLNLTAEDEQIMREDWLLDPHNLQEVRIYQELLQLQRQNATLRAQVADRDEHLREYGEAREAAGGDYGRLPGKIEAVPADPLLIQVIRRLLT